MIVVVDGPEKSGKTTLCAALAFAGENAGLEIVRRKHGKECIGHEDIYALHMAEDAYLLRSRKELVIWDRAWASEFVYGHLMNRDSQIRKDPSNVERYLGSQARSNGQTIILLGPDGTRLHKLRSNDDQPVDPWEERRLFGIYGRWLGWDVIENPHTPGIIEALASRVLTRCLETKHLVYPLSQ